MRRQTDTPIVFFCVPASYCFDVTVACLLLWLYVCMYIHSEHTLPLELAVWESVTWYCMEGDHVICTLRGLNLQSLSLFVDEKSDACL